MTRDETISTLVLHGWEPFMTGSTILGIHIVAGIFNTDTRRTITFAPPGQLQRSKLDKAAVLETCEWDEVNDDAIEVFGRVYDHVEVISGLQRSVAMRNAQLDHIDGFSGWHRGRSA